MVNYLRKLSNSDYRSQYEAVIAQYQQAQKAYNSDAVPSLSFDAP
jgi:hypothetical protein